MSNDITVRKARKKPTKIWIKEIRRKNCLLCWNSCCAQTVKSNLSIIRGNNYVLITVIVNVLFLRLNLHFYLKRMTSFLYRCSAPLDDKLEIKLHSTTKLMRFKSSWQVTFEPSQWTWNNQREKDFGIVTLFFLYFILCGYQTTNCHLLP